LQFIEPSAFGSSMRNSLRSQIHWLTKTFPCWFAFVAAPGAFATAAAPPPTQSEVKTVKVLETTSSWDGVQYKAYPTGQPQVTLLKISIPPHTTLDWHRHPMINVAYVLSGSLTVQKRETGQRITLHAGQALAETVQSVHRGYTLSEPVVLIVFYAGRPGLPVTIKEK
jgi:quercetin dioxygenase-like cupin family protein